MYRLAVEMDSDRYIKNTYAKVAKIVNPSLEIFMGDLLDEGVRMTSEEFDYTRSRFHRLFPLEEDVNRIYIPVIMT
uniref:Uncharacterized protein n=1 Tax=Ditylenchus dipsaci TaxID=166011 RepID=A0A915E681_9BILA